MALLNILLECIPCAGTARDPTIERTNTLTTGTSHTWEAIPEKAPSMNYQTPPPRAPTAELVASQILTALLSAPKPGPTLDASILSIIHTHRPSTTSAHNWYASIAEALFHKLESLLKQGTARLSGAMADAFRDASKAVDAVGEFAREHPLWTAAVVGVVVFGIMVLLAPYLLEALGFAELGPLEGKRFACFWDEVRADGVGGLGSFAAGWQARYLGAVPKGSLFSFFQRLGMVWGKIVVMREG